MGCSPGSPEPFGSPLGRKAAAWKPRGAADAAGPPEEAVTGGGRFPRPPWARGRVSTALKTTETEPVRQATASELPELHLI